MMAWSRLPMARSGSGISAIFASTSLSPPALSARGPRLASAFSSWARFLGALLHRGSFLVRESLGLLVDRGGALGGLLRGLLCAHRSLLCRLSNVLLIWVCGPSLQDTHGRRLLYALLRCSAPVLCSRDAHRCWTGAMRTSEKTPSTRWGE